MAGKEGMRRSLPLRVPEGASPCDSLFSLVDGRSLPVRAVNAAYAAIMRDIGGEENASYARRSLVLRAANVETWLASVESRLLAGEPASADLLKSYLHANNTYLGLLRAVGLDRKPKEIPSLQEFLRQRAEEQDQPEKSPDE